jgi:hypothetical protein
VETFRTSPSGISATCWSTSASRRTEGSHRIYLHPTIPELVNLQDVGGQAKPYQIRQVLRLIERYNLKLEDAS